MGYTKKINNGDYTPKEMPRSASIPPPQKRRKVYTSNNEHSSAKQKR